MDGKHRRPCRGKDSRTGALLFIGKIFPFYLDARSTIMQSLPCNGRAASFRAYGGRAASFRAYGGRTASFRAYGGRTASFRAYGGRTASFRAYGGRTASFRAYGVPYENGQQGICFPLHIGSPTEAHRKKLVFLFTGKIPIEARRTFHKDKPHPIRP